MMYIIYQIMATGSSADYFENGMRLGLGRKSIRITIKVMRRTVTTLVLSRRRGSMPVGRRSC